MTVRFIFNDFGGLSSWSSRVSTYCFHLPWHALSLCGYSNASDTDNDNVTLSCIVLVMIVSCDRLSQSHVLAVTTPDWLVFDSGGLLVLWVVLALSVLNPPMLSLYDCYLMMSDS
jgi:hypothetical protein